MKNKKYGFCLKRSDKCGYCGGEECKWEQDHFLEYQKCADFTNDAKRILKNIKDIEILEIIGKQIIEKVGVELDLLLYTCYYGVNRESAIEHLRRIFFEEYGMRMLYNEQEK